MSMNEPMCCGNSEMPAIQKSFLDRMMERKMKTEAELAEINSAIAALEANPEVEKVLTALARIGQIRSY